MKLENFLVFALVFSISLLVLGSGTVNQITPFVVASLNGNLPPNTVTPSINTSQGTNTPSDPVNCFAIVTDPNGDSLNVSFRWYNNNLLRYTSSFYRLYANGSLVKDTYYSALSGDTIRCAIQVSDNQLSTNWISSSSLLIQGTNPTCSDGTVYSSCSVTKPKYCLNGNLANFCSSCGCPSGLSCNATGGNCYNSSGQPAQTCSDGTLYNACSATKPKYCSNGTLVNNCVSCGCMSSYGCNSTSGLCYVPTQPSNQTQNQTQPTCSDRTAYNSCSLTLPKYCSNGTLTDKCSSCGCPSGQSCNYTDSSCYASTTPGQRCTDGTAYGVCSKTAPKYCDNGQLKDKCSYCGCQANLLCNYTANSCYKPPHAQQRATLYTSYYDNFPNLVESQAEEIAPDIENAETGNYIVEF